MYVSDLVTEWQMNNDVFAGPVSLVDNPSTSWRSSKLALSSTTRVRCILQGQQLHVCSHKRQIRQNLSKRMESLTEECLLLSVVPRLLQYISSFRCGWTSEREAGARRLQSQQQNELMQRKRADVSMTTFEGAASCCCITVPSSPFFHDFSQSLICTLQLNPTAGYKISEINFSVRRIVFMSVKAF